MPLDLRKLLPDANQAQSLIDGDRDEIKACLREAMELKKQLCLHASLECTDLSYSLDHFQRYLAVIHRYICINPKAESLLLNNLEVFKAWLRRNYEHTAKHKTRKCPELVSDTKTLLELLEPTKVP